MKPALGSHFPEIPINWEALPSGNLILEHINQVLEPWWPKFFGYHLLKIGSLSSEITTTSSLINHQINVSPTIPRMASTYDVVQTKNGILDKSTDKHTIKQKAKVVNVIADIDDLPFVEHSVDVCLLSHLLEFNADPHHVVREANRVLIPNGYIVITGYNPFSIVGLNKLIPYNNKKFPWNERFFSPNRVKDWLALMGYEILTDERVLFSRLNGEVSHGSIEKKWQKIANQYLTCFGSIYVLVAKKRRLPLTPIKPKWLLKPNFKPVSASTMNSSTPSKKC